MLTLLYLNNVPYWPEDDRLRSKHVAVMRLNFIYYITVLIYCCVLTVYNALYNLLIHNGMASVKKEIYPIRARKEPWGSRRFILYEILENRW